MFLSAGSTPIGTRFSARWLFNPQARRDKRLTDTDAMQHHIDEIALHVARGAHAVLLLDRAGWHTTGNLVWPKNITPILLPSRSPELNPVEQVWQYLRANFLSNRVFETYDDIIDAACDAWRKLITRPSLDDLARQAGISRRQIERLFRQYLGTPPWKYFNALRLEKARQLVRFTSMPITEIGIACGLVSPSHFARCFRTKFKTSPSAIRRSVFVRS